MEEQKFVDYYALLEISPDTNATTLGRVFRYLAQLYHPDNQDTGDRLRFDLVLEAYNTLKDPSRRAQYDVRYRQQTSDSPKPSADSASGETVERDVEIQDRLLSIYYMKRRQDFRDPGVPEYELERLFGCPVEELEFNLWYLKEKSWIARLENGMYAITINGIDHVNSEHHRKVTTKLITDRNFNG